MMIFKEKFIIEKEDVGERIDRFLSDNLAEVSRSRIQKLIDENQVTVNEKECKSNYKIRLDDEIVLTIPEPVEVDIKAENIPLDIIYEDEDVIVVNKPKNMVVHPAIGHYTGTLVNALMYHCKGNLSGINGELRPGIVHRIDMNTTGLLVACKNDFAHNFIAKQLKDHSSKRRYEAIVYNNIKDDEGTIDAPIARSKNDRKKMAIDKKNGKNAITHYKVIKRFEKYTHIECNLETGRTHQIRVHMAMLNHPILGDDLYGPKSCPYNLIGQTLHAGLLGFVHPRTKSYVEFSVKRPEYFEKLITSILK